MHVITGPGSIQKPMEYGPVADHHHKLADNYIQGLLKQVSVDLPQGVPSSLVTKQLATQQKLEALHNRWKLGTEAGKTDPYPYKEALLISRGFTDTLESFFQKSPGYRHWFNQIQSGR